MNISDRSRSIAYGTCERLRFLNYHALETGIVPKNINLSLVIGSIVHKGVEALLKTGDIDSARNTLLKEFNNLITKPCLEGSLIAGENVEDEDFIFEQRTLVEALLYVYYLIEYPKLKSEYEILEVEKEIEWNLVEPTYIVCENCFIDGIRVVNNCKTCNNTGKIAVNEILFLSRPDAILRDKSTNGLIVYSLKTASAWISSNNGEDSMQEKQNKYDDQGISELIAVERLYSTQKAVNCYMCNSTGEYIGDTCSTCKGKGGWYEDTNEKVEAIKMCYLIKGQRKSLKDYTSDSYKRIQNSFLAHPYFKDDGFNEEYALSFTGRPPKGWKRINIWEVMDIKDWIAILYENFYPELEKLVVTPYPYVREDEDIENWIQQVGYQETQINSNLEHLKTYEPALVGPRESNKNGSYKERLNEYFPQRRNSCFRYNSFCPYAPICWDGERTTSDLYKSRIPNHPKELKLFQLTRED